MMYQIIAQALQKAGLSGQYSPQDYLNFYCLGKREPLSADCPANISSSSENNSAVMEFFLFSDIYSIHRSV